MYISSQTFLRVASESSSDSDAFNILIKLILSRKVSLGMDETGSADGILDGPSFFNVFIKNSAIFVNTWMKKQKKFVVTT